METVLSTDRNIKLLKEARSLGYEITCIYVTTVDPRINVERAKKRAVYTGHGVGAISGVVDEQKVIDRYYRAMKLIPQLLKLCDRLLIYDNSFDRSEGSAALIAEYRNGIGAVFPSPKWSLEMLLSLMAGEYVPAE